MKEGLVALIYVFVRSVLSTVAQALWDGMWEELFAGIEEAERRWRESGNGEEKKEFVQKYVMEYLREHLELGFVRERAFEMFLGWTIDGIVKAINEELGHDWVEKVEQYKDEIARFISFIE